MVREYLFCALRDKYQEEVAQVRAAYAATNATYDMAVQDLNQSYHETRLEYESQIHATEHMYIAQIAAIQAEHEACEAQVSGKGRVRAVWLRGRWSAGG